MAVVIPFDLKGNWETRRVWVDDLELDPALSQKVRNHSPDGFAWGYGGSGPAQLALSLMLYWYGPITNKRNKKFITEQYQMLKWKLIAALPQKDFHIQGNLILQNEELTINYTNK